MSTLIDVSDPRPGDLATHLHQELDPRRVTRVEGDQVYLFLLVEEAGPFPAANYRFSRWVEDGVTTPSDVPNYSSCTWEEGTVLIHHHRFKAWRCRHGFVKRHLASAAGPIVNCGAKVAATFDPTIKWKEKHR